MNPIKEKLKSRRLKSRAVRARELTRLGARLQARQARTDAAGASGEAVALWRSIVAESSDEYQNELAEALGSHGISLGRIGRYEEAAQITAEAIEIYRASGARRTELARELSNQSNRLSALSRRDEAYEAAAEALDLYRQLAVERPSDAIENDVARASANLSVRLYALARHSDALDLARESVAIRTGLAERDPLAFGEDLAWSLTNLGNRLAEINLHDEALDCGREAVERYRFLVASNQSRYLPDLAWSLSYLGNRLDDASRWSEALHAEEEALEIRRRLARDDPAGYQDDFAESLQRLSLRLNESGRYEEARELAAEAVSVRRSLYPAGGSGGRKRSLASALTNLATQLNHAAAYGLAADAAEEAVELRRTLADANLKAGAADLANSLSILGIARSGCGELSSALAAEQEATAIRRALYDVESLAHAPALAISLTNLGNRLIEVDQTETAVEAWVEACAMEVPLRCNYPSFVSLMSYVDSANYASHISAVVQGLEFQMSSVHTQLLSARTEHDRRTVVRHLAGLLSDGLVFMADEVNADLALEWTDSLSAATMVLTSLGRDPALAHLARDHPQLSSRMSMSLRTWSRAVDDENGDSTADVLRQAGSIDGFGALARRRQASEIIESLKRPTAIVAMGASSGVVVVIEPPETYVERIELRRSDVESLVASSRHVAGRIDLRHVVERCLLPVLSPVAMRSDQDLVVVPVGIASWLPIQSTCAIHDLRIEIRPHLRTVRKAVADGPPVVAFSDGPEADGLLVHGRLEALEVARICGARVLTDGEGLSVHSLLEAMVGSALVHLSCHGRSADGGGRAALLFGKEHLELGNLAAFLDNAEAPAFVGLSACSTAVPERGNPEQAVGFPATLMAAGARAVLATHWPVFDEAAREFCENFYRRWAAGVSAGEAFDAAIREAVAAGRGVSPGTLGSHLAFCLYGDRQMAWPIRYLSEAG